MSENEVTETSEDEDKRPKYDSELDTEPDVPDQTDEIDLSGFKKAKKKVNISTTKEYIESESEQSENDTDILKKVKKDKSNKKR